MLADKVLHVDTMILVWLWSAYGAGMVLISMALAVSKQRPASTRVLFITVAMLIGGGASFMLSSTAVPVFSLGLVAVIGAGLASFTPIVWGLLQEMTPEALRGRIFAIFNTAAMSVSMIGMVVFGWVTDRVGGPMSLLGLSVMSTLARSLPSARGWETP